MSSQSAVISPSTPKRWSFWRRCVYEFFALTFPPIFKRLFKVKIYGLENVPPEGQGVILAANHVSFLDGFLVPISLIPPRRNLFFAGAEDVFNKPYFRWVKLAGGLIVRPAKSKKILGSMRSAKGVYFLVTLLKDGSAVLFFPEGKRSSKGFLPPKVGVGWTAHLSRVPVLPVYLDGVKQAFPLGTWKIRFGSRLRIIFGDPIPLEKYYNLPLAKETSQKIAAKVMQEIIKLKEKLQRCIFEVEN
ncbi:MAG: lysophospholipid acyltransferase family protein [Promethearchaeota archaeon]